MCILYVTLHNITILGTSVRDDANQDNKWLHNKRDLFISIMNMNFKNQRYVFLKWILLLGKQLYLFSYLFLCSRKLTLIGTDNAMWLLATYFICALWSFVGFVGLSLETELGGRQSYSEQPAVPGPPGLVPSLPAALDTRCFPLLLWQSGRPCVLILFIILLSPFLNFWQ